MRAVSVALAFQLVSVPMGTEGREKERRKKTGNCHHSHACSLGNVLDDDDRFNAIWREYLKKSNRLDNLEVQVETKDQATNNGMANDSVQFSSSLTTIS